MTRLTPPAPDPSEPLHTALRELLRVHAPGASLLAALGARVLHLEPGGLHTREGAELVPPDAWLDRGELAWLTRDGALLGLLWSEDAPIPPGAVDLLTLLLSVAREDGAQREAEVLITQLPVPAAWLSADLTFRQVSRPWLELFGRTEAGVVGRPLPDVLPHEEAVQTALAQAAAGRGRPLPDLRLPVAGGRRAWLRGEARPYFGGAAAGVLWTLQDVSAEYEGAAHLAALLRGTRARTALLRTDGTVLHASQELLDLTPAGAAPLRGAALWTWAAFADAPSAAARDLVRQAARGGAARAEVGLAREGTLTLELRRAASADRPGDLLVLEAHAAASADEPAPQEAGGILAQVLALSGSAALLVDHAGRTALVSEGAADLLGLEVPQLLDRPLLHVLDATGVRLYWPDGTRLPLPDRWPPALPLERELLLVRPGRSTRHLDVRGTRVDGEHPATVLILHDVTALRHAQARLRHGLHHDPLTDLPNRAGLREALARAAASGGGTVVCLDVGGLGALNAALGRTAGDHLLIGVAARLQHLAGGAGGQAARLADDTFAVLLPQHPPVQAEAAVRSALAAPLRAGQRDVPLTFALGLAPLPPAAPETALTDAEVALRHARRQGRGAARIFSPALREQEAHAFRQEEALREALAEEAGGQAVGQDGQATRELAVQYQPVLHLATNRIIAAEARPHWASPLPPAGPVPLTPALDEWLVRQVLAQGQRWRATFPELRLSVKLGLEALGGADGGEGLLALLAGPDAPAVEVRAGRLPPGAEGVPGHLDRLHARGVRLWLEGFGEGRASLLALAHAPLTGVKLHPALTARLPHDPRTVALVAALLDLARRLELQVTAAGVETAAQLDVLRDLGCDAAQGAAIGAPLPPDGFGAWLRNWPAPPR
ncbi:hypothetical protein DEIPH_ctg004orf0171 [Deinococcus phoenicis]|uniref:Uncharacterized protein n=1 Tax=Deinococcus phoenicis TaxID=1476583 RepID=A0A016QUU6_9DEIO|nr:EAL domain-containing protein [Deinococcus phoenicis]EYB69642.1 hypothetical protein DEIPH_ctg004orf0171 [Deinococcus phoenicis]